MEKSKLFQEMAERWPSNIVARRDIRKFTGGLVTPGTMSNLDSLGQGPERVKVGRYVGYPIDSLVRWLESRAK